MGTNISKGNREITLRITTLAIMLYGDSKKLTLSQYSFLARVAISEMVEQFSFDNESHFSMSFQYLMHREYTEIFTIDCRNPQTTINNLGSE